jgi:hypothetical protein
LQIYLVARKNKRTKKIRKFPKEEDDEMRGLLAK